MEEERRIAAERSAEMQMKFVEFEEFNEIVRSLQADQERIMEECNAMEQTNVNKFNELEGKVEDVQGKINDFLTDVQKDMTDKKNKLIGDLKLNIEKLQKQQKTSTDLIKKLQQQNIERSKVLEVKLGLVEHKFEDTVQMKDSFANFYNANVSLLIYSAILHVLAVNIDKCSISGKIICYRMVTLLTLEAWETVKDEAARFQSLPVQALT